MSRLLCLKQGGFPFVSIQTMAKLINKVGIENVLLKLTQGLKHDFARWHEFDKITPAALCSAFLLMA
ncbi:hypothetical protein ACOBV9_21605 (plasmid) [Pseudoalteromonas espejiana]